MPTVYECGECHAIVNCVWNWAGKQLCRRCFGIAKGFGDQGAPSDNVVRIVKADGTITEVGAKGKPAPVAPGETVPFGGAGTRKIRLPRE